MKKNKTKRSSSATGSDAFLFGLEDVPPLDLTADNTDNVDITNNAKNVDGAVNADTVSSVALDSSTTANTNLVSDALPNDQVDNVELSVDINGSALATEEAEDRANNIKSTEGCYANSVANIAIDNTAGTDNTERSINSLALAEENINYEPALGASAAEAVPSTYNTEKGLLSSFIVRAMHYSIAHNLNSDLVVNATVPNNASTESAAANASSKASSVGSVNTTSTASVDKSAYLADGHINQAESEVVQRLVSHAPQVLKLLLTDQTQSTLQHKYCSIFWATSDYASLGKGFQYFDQLTPESFKDQYSNKIVPRILKQNNVQSERSRSMAEVFSPSWLCNAQNNLVDEQWFGRAGVFNIPRKLSTPINTFKKPSTATVTVTNEVGQGEVSPSSQCVNSGNCVGQKNAHSSHCANEVSAANETNTESAVHAANGEQAVNSVGNPTVHHAVNHATNQTDDASVHAISANAAVSASEENSVVVTADSVNEAHSAAVTADVTDSPANADSAVSVDTIISVDTVVAGGTTETAEYADYADIASDYLPWQVNPSRIEFPEGKTWQDYVMDVRLETACGEAPYLVSRYDTTSGKLIKLHERIGLLDRKMRVVDENTQDQNEWFTWAKKAYQSIYAYEWQGDNLLLARESLLFSFCEYFACKFGQPAPQKMLLQIAEIISWNVWQMDGLKNIIPCSEQQANIAPYTNIAPLFAKHPGSSGLLNLDLVDNLLEDSNSEDGSECSNSKVSNNESRSRLQSVQRVHGEGIQCLIKDWFASDNGEDGADEDDEKDVLAKDELTDENNVGDTSFDNSQSNPSSIEASAETQLNPASDQTTIGQNQVLDSNQTSKLSATECSSSATECSSSETESSSSGASQKNGTSNQEGRALMHEGVVISFASVFAG